MHSRRIACISLLCAANAVASTPQDGPAPDTVSLPGITLAHELQGARNLAKVDGDRLTLASGPGSDNFRDPDGKQVVISAPLLLADVDNRRPFTLTARITPQLEATYDAGALYVWVNPTRWLKVAMERDERGRARVVTVRTEGTSDDNNHDVVQAASVFMKISSDGTRVGCYYSLDNRTWQLVRLFRNTYPDALQVGVSAQSPTGKGNVVTFDRVTLVETAVSDFRTGR